MLKSLAVLTSGGDSPGMNAAVRAVIRRGLDHGLRYSGSGTGTKGWWKGVPPSVLFHGRMAAVFSPKEELSWERLVPSGSERERGVTARRSTSWKGMFRL